MSKMGRPKKQFDWESFQKLCDIQCTIEEIARFFNLSVDTIERRVKEKYKITFAEHYKIASAQGKMSLRRKQFEIALNGNVGMLIWLGKQYLGQTDKQLIGNNKDDVTGSASPFQLVINAPKTDGI